jgi:hypothetical protein
MSNPKNPPKDPNDPNPFGPTPPGPIPAVEKQRGDNGPEKETHGHPTHPARHRD